MTTPISVDSKPQIQLPSAVIAIESQTGVINPSRNITAEDEMYLRDYELAAAVISWELQLYGTSAEYKTSNITNICISGDTVWYQIDFDRAYPLNIETFHTYRLQIEQENNKAIALRPRYVIAPNQTPKISLIPEKLQYEWKVTYDSKWDWYWVWVNDRTIARASTYEQAEQLAQEYVAGVEFWTAHREKVLNNLAA